ncbi:hypothetical protein [Bacillus sp. V59.32b]|uniref:hypothetical protein n=1 Tax=Bacillus sp. V59.32b TaxID=1758642 RepID=UPI000E3D121B|nr:hypothetical protein [Bacillus sp. V59.32b]RFU70003.1 hypothetical protein D0463_00580 [Bacillus sp. V59.32b]
MGNLKINNVKKLNRRDKNHLYLYIASSNEIKEWKLKNGDPFLGGVDGVLYLTCLDIMECFCVNSNQLSIEITAPLLRSDIGININNDFLVVIQKQNLQDTVKSMFQNDSLLNTWIEIKGSRVSKNSLKVITINSLKNIMSTLFSNNSISETEEFTTFLRIYLQEFIKENSIYFPYSVKQMVEIKESTVVHSVNTWYILIKYFKEQWENSYEQGIKAPIFLKEITYKNWQGNFFDRSSPFWLEFNKDSKRPFYPSKSNQEIIYKAWKDLTEPS